MTLDSLEAAQRAVPMSCGVLPEENHPGHHACWPDYPALAAAARKWVNQNMPNRLLAEWATETEKASAYNHALADVAKALGLEP